MPRRPYYYFCGAVSPTRNLVELQFRDWLSAQVRRVRQRIMRCFDLQVCFLDILPLTDCLELGIRRSQQPRKLNPLRGWARRWDCRGRARLANMLQYLPIRRRLCDEPP